MKARSPMVTDERIVELYFERNEDAILETDRKYRPYLYTIAHNILNDRFDCEECLDDTYMSTWNSIPPKRPDILHAFLARITRNAATDRYKKNRAQKRVPSELILSLEELDKCFPACESPEDALVTDEICRILKNAPSLLLRRRSYRIHYAEQQLVLLGQQQNPTR